MESFLILRKCKYEISFFILIEKFVNGYVYLIICVNSNKKLATLVEGDLKALFTIVTTPRCKGGRYSIP